MSARQPEGSRTGARGRKVLLALLGLGVIGGLVGAAFLSGYLVADREAPPYGLIKKVENRLMRMAGVEERPTGLQPREYPTTLLRLSSSVARLPPLESYHPVAGNGGGLTAFGQDVLLVTFDGRIFAASDESTLRELPITPPDNGRAAYEALASDPSLAHLQIRRGYLRYNDLLMLDRARPDGARVRELVLSYTDFDDGRRCYRNAVAIAEIPDAAQTADDIEIDAQDWRVLTMTEPCLEMKDRHFAIEGHVAGGRMVFQTPSTLILASGDFHIDGMRSAPGYAVAQDPDAQYGKVLAIDIDTGATRTMSSGHRNPQGVALWTDGAPMVVEHGPRGGDEINIIRDGANYGWPLESLGTGYESRGPLPGALSFGRHDNFPGPLYAWVPSIAPSAMTVAHGVHPAWDGDILVTSLIDQSLHRLRIEDDRVIYSERIPIGARLRDIHVLEDGRIVLWTDNREIVFLAPADHVSLDNLIAVIGARYGWSEDARRRVGEAASLCAECHAFDAEDHEKAPGLAHVLGAPVGSTPFQGYSDALRGVSGVWTEDALRTFIVNPEAVAPGTTMPPTGLSDGETLDRLIVLLKDISIAF
jgi:cytochrome c2